MQQPPLYPLKFKPIFKEKIWGGSKLRDLLDKDFGDLKNCGESWELSGVKGDVSEVAEGPLANKSLNELIETYGAELLGVHVFDQFGLDFPLLIKFIDANQDLSIQVHPDDEMAKARHDSYGKTEMWYVVQADKGASLISGFNRATNQEEYQRIFEAGEITSILNREEVETDDVFYLPAGRVHTIGEGLVIAEIQQTSDITYRIYDFDRIDDNGQKRELHVDQALEAIDYGFYDDYKTDYDRSAAEINLAASKYFVTNRLLIGETSHRDYSITDSFIVLMVLEGQGNVYFDAGRLSYKKGDTLLIPACLSGIEIQPEYASKLLEVTLPE